MYTRLRGSARVRRPNRTTLTSPLGRPRRVQVVRPHTTAARTHTHTHFTNKMLLLAAIPILDHKVEETQRSASPRAFSVRTRGTSTPAARVDRRGAGHQHTSRRSPSRRAVGRTPDRRHRRSQKPRRGRWPSPRARQKPSPRPFCRHVRTSPSHRAVPVVVPPHVDQPSDIETYSV